MCILIGSLGVSDTAGPQTALWAWQRLRVDFLGLQQLCHFLPNLFMAPTSLTFLPLSLLIALQAFLWYDVSCSPVSHPSCLSLPFSHTLIFSCRGFPSERPMLPQVILQARIPSGLYVYMYPLPHEPPSHPTSLGQWLSTELSSLYYTVACH